MTVSENRARNGEILALDPRAPGSREWANLQADEDERQDIQARISTGLHTVGMMGCASVRGFFSGAVRATAR